MSTLRSMGSPVDARWSDSATWEGEGLRREVLFFPSRQVDLFASYYAAAEPRLPFGLVFCPSWGMEADNCNQMAHALALGTARLGGAGIVYHYPGYGDSRGDPRALTFEALVDAAADAAGQAAARAPDLEWVVAGFRLGAAVACVVQRQLAARGLLLIQPALRPGEHFADLVARARRAALGRPATDDMVFGYPLPESLKQSAAAADSSALDALERFDGPGAQVRHVRPPASGPPPAGLDRVDVPERWRFGGVNNWPLQNMADYWLKQRAAAGGLG